ncbi:hypothetical protein Ahy_A06g030193 [Arachis hypogaea]|uniref:Aminotransferase-like plant mobile domain-containing protein n=1 Tax=Arachis hypogaea TaxID=3818 RepID=A0A445CVM6_ARAHY|nr:hypothetical protein Ahy_A06g030193 [Arachis hypogaea]
MSQKPKRRKVDRPELHIIKYLSYSDYVIAVSRKRHKTYVATGFKRTITLSDENSIQVYVKCHIMLLIGTILFGDKTGASVHWKFLPLLIQLGISMPGTPIQEFKQASRYDCKEIDGPLTLLLCWAWMRLSIADSNGVNEMRYIRWRNWECGDRVYRYLKLAHFRKAFDDLEEGQFLWTAYSVDRVDPDIILADMYMHAVIWSATVPLPGNSGAGIASKSKTRMKDGSSNGTSFASAFATSSNEIVNGITTFNGSSYTNFTPSGVCNKI